MDKYYRILVVDAEKVEGGYDVKPRNNFTEGFISDEDFRRFFVKAEDNTTFKGVIVEERK